MAWTYEKYKIYRKERLMPVRVSSRKRSNAKKYGQAKAVSGKGANYKSRWCWTNEESICSSSFSYTIVQEIFKSANFTSPLYRRCKGCREFVDVLKFPMNGDTCRTCIQTKQKPVKTAKKIPRSSQAS